MSLAITNALVAVFVCVDLRHDKGWAVLPNLVLGCCMPAVLIAAALVTSLCESVAPYVALLGPKDAALDYHHLSQFLSCSQVGYVVFFMRLKMEHVQKGLYMTSLLVFTLASRLLGLV